MVARACLVSTFFEDGIRMWTQWNEQREYMDISWGCGWFLATMFVVINLIGQLGGVIMVMGRLKVEIACGVLFFIVVLQVRFPLTDLIRAETNVSNLTQPHFFKNCRRSPTVFYGTYSSCSATWPWSEPCCWSWLNPELKANHFFLVYHLLEKTSLRYVTF